MKDSVSGLQNTKNSFSLGSIFPEPEKEEFYEPGNEAKEGGEKMKFTLLPEELEEYLSSFVIKQPRAIEVLATKICTHFHRIKLLNKNSPVGFVKNNILMIGPTGVGKTYIIKLIAEKLGVPFVKTDATKFSETGYVGKDVEDMIRELVHISNGDIERAQYGIVYIDEIDKIASRGNRLGADVSREGVQRNLLKLMEETDVDMKPPHDMASQMEAAMQFQKTGKMDRKKINTKNILFIVSGAFGELDEIIKRRTNVQSIGFGLEYASSKEKDRILSKLKAEDLIAYGLESEFVGRLPVRVTLEKLYAKDLFKILKNPNCPITIGKKLDFKSYGIDIKFEDSALMELAEKAYMEKTGARGLVSVIEEALIRFEKKLPSTDIKRLIVTDELIKKPDQVLENIVNNQDKYLKEIEKHFTDLVYMEKDEMKEEIEAFESEYRKQSDPTFAFSDIGRQFIINAAYNSEESIERFCKKIVNFRKPILQFQKIFKEKFDISIEFDPEAKDTLAIKSIEANVPTLKTCKEIFASFEHGLKLIKNNTGKSEFLISKEGIESPEKYVEKLIKQYYKEHNNPGS